jgi:hypothetical protein
MTDCLSAFSLTKKYLQNHTRSVYNTIDTGQKKVPQTARRRRAPNKAGLSNPAQQV